MSDVALVMDTMSGPDRHDNLTFDAMGHYPENGYSSQIAGKDALRGMKLGLSWDPYWSTIGVSCLSLCCVVLPCRCIPVHSGALDGLNS